MIETLYNLDNEEDNLLNILNDIIVYANQLVKVNELSALPTADSSGVINLLDNTTYEFSTDVDLLGNRLVGGSNTVILGFSSENSVNMNVIMEPVS